MTRMTMDQAIQSAIALNENIGKDGVTSAYSELEKALRAFKTEEGPLESIIPKGEDASLGFSIRSADARKFFEIYSSLIRKSLCPPDGEFNKLIKSGLDSSVGVVLTQIVTSLGIPMAALGIMVPVAVIIANTGLDAFCRLTEQKK